MLSELSIFGFENLEIRSHRTRKPSRGERRTDSRSREGGGIVDHREADGRRVQAMGKSITVVIAAPFAPASLGLALVSALPRWRVDAFGGGRYVSVVPLLLVSYFVSLAALLLLDTGNRKEHKGKDDDAMPPQAKVHPLQAVPDAPTGAAKPRRRDSLAGLGHDELVDCSALAERELDVRRAAELLHLAHNLDPECHSTRLQLCKVRCDLGFLIFDVSNGHHPEKLTLWGLRLSLTCGRWP